MGLLSNLAGRDSTERPAAIPLPARVLPVRSVSESAVPAGREPGARHLPVCLVTEFSLDSGTPAME